MYLSVADRNSCFYLGVNSFDAINTLYNRYHLFNPFATAIAPHQAPPLIYTTSDLLESIHKYHVFIITMQLLMC